ncbi:hypothetical protein HZB60_07610 [candidate division KSB1 bacterium]|nr:hypothetical protein [candidate division KSB1 bacterium]
MLRRLLSLIFVVCAVRGWPQESTPIVLERANSLQSFETNGTRWQELRGDVMMTRDSLTVTCQNALYYPDSGLVIFTNNVEFRDPTRLLLADEVIYNDFTQEVLATSNVRIYQQDTLSATARKAKYRQRFKQAWLYDDVRLREENRRILLSGAVGYLDHERNYGWVAGNPVLVERDSSLRVTTEIHGDTVIYDDALDQARCVGKVTIERDSLIASGSDLVYSTQQKVAVLTGSPVATRAQDVINGDTLKLHFEGEVLDRVEVIGNALATSPADSGFSEPRHRMEGQRMTLWVDSSRISRALIEGNAIATYFVREDSQPRGLNITSGDRLRVFFDEHKISRIRVEGGTEGNYTPQRLMAAAAADTTAARPQSTPPPPRRAPGLPRR